MSTIYYANAAPTIYYYANAAVYTPSPLPAVQHPVDTQAEPSSTTCKSDAESDSISTLMNKRLSKKQALKARKLALALESQRRSAKDTATPSTPFYATVQSNTGFSPINPTGSLSDAFDQTGPPPPQRAVSLSTPTMEAYIPPPSPPAFLSPVGRVLSTMPPTPVVTRPPYRVVRPQLFQDAFFQSISGAKFDDTEIHVFSARTRSGTAHKSRILHARSAFLEAASVKFEDEIYARCTVSKGSHIRRSGTRVDYGYDGDSDLEDCEDDLPALSVRSTTSLDKHPVIVHAVTETEMVPLMPADDATRSSPGASDIMSLDGCESESGLSDLIDDARQQIQVPDAPMCMYEDGPATAVCTPLRPVLKLETSSPALNFKAEEQFRTPEDAALEAALHELQLNARPQEEPTPVSPISTSVPTASTAVRETKEAETVVDDGERVLFIGDSAHKTWEALLLYLYNDHLSFAPLRSEGHRQSIPTNTKPRCSPKSMYRLADKLDLVDLKQSAVEALERSLSKDNIVKELFSDFTWRYPEVLQMETDIYYRHCSEPTVQVAMSETFQDIAYGQLPHSSVVLDSLFKKFASMTCVR